MESKEQQELLTTGLGAACVGMGAMFTLFPGFMNKQGGFGVEKGPGRNALLRLAGMRDVAFGVGLLLNRTDQKAAKIWLQMLVLIAGSDIVVLGISLPRSKSKAKTLLGMFMSAAVTALALRGSRQ